MSAKNENHPEEFQDGFGGRETTNIRLLNLFLDAGSFAVATLQVIQLCPAHFTALEYVDLINKGRHYRENTLDANSV